MYFILVRFFYRCSVCARPRSPTEKIGLKLLCRIVVHCFGIYWQNTTHIAAQSDGVVRVAGGKNDKKKMLRNFTPCYVRGSGSGRKDDFKKKIFSTFPLMIINKSIHLRPSPATRRVVHCLASNSLDHVCRRFFWSSPRSTAG